MKPFLVLVSLLLVGCATTNPEEERTKYRKELVKFSNSCHALARCMSEVPSLQPDPKLGCNVALQSNKKLLISEAKQLKVAEAICQSVRIKLLRTK